MSGPCAAFSIVFGLAYGELFGDLGRRWFGLNPLIFDREAAVIPFLVLAVAIGAFAFVRGDSGGLPTQPTATTGALVEVPDVVGQTADQAIAVLQAAGLEVTSVTDVSPVPHNGCRPRKRRRV